MATDQEVIEKFLDELVKEITGKYSQDIDFVILFGSAARGEFKIGISDIDLIIQLKGNQGQREIEQFASKVFWRLNKKYKIQFEKVLSTVKSRSSLDNFLKSIEKEAHLYVPLFVFPAGWLDWGKGRVVRPRWRLPSIFFIHQAFVFQKLKEEGKVLYGRDIRPSIDPKISFWERWKAIQVPFWISLFSILVLFLIPKKSVKWATKAILYELDSALDFLGRKLPTKEEKTSALKRGTTSVINTKLFDLHFKLTLSFLSAKDFEIFDKASSIKLGELVLSRSASIKFVLQAFWFIVRTNWSVVIKLSLTKKNLLRGLVFLICIGVTAYFVISFYALYKLVHPKPKPLNFNPTEISQNYEGVSFEGRDDKLRLSGWFFKANNSDKVVILVSGSDQNRVDPGYSSDKVTRDLLKAGFNVLLFDFRGRGNSGYAIYSIGAYERRDLAGAFDYLTARGYHAGRIGIIAISLGAGTAILTLPLIPHIGGIVADSSYADIKTLIARELPGRSRLPRFFFWGIGFWAKTIYDIRIDELVPLEIIKQNPQRRFLFIHGTGDGDIPITDSIELANGSPQSELWLVPEAGHVKAYETSPREYIKRVTNYFNREFE